MEWQQVAVTVQQGKGYKKMIAGRVFFLCGSEQGEEAAKKKAAAVFNWLERQAPERRRWSKDSVAEAKALIKRTARDKSRDPDPAPVVVADRRGGLTLHGAIELFKKHLTTRQAAGDIGRDHCHEMGERLDRIKDGFRNEVGEVINPSLDAVGLEDIERARQYWTARPISDKTGQRLGVQTVVNLVATMQSLFIYLDKKDKWIAPRHFADAFQFEPRKIMDDGEKLRAKKPKPTFTLDDLKTLYRLATPHGRMYMLAGLTLGWTQKELATLRKEEIEDDGTTMRINRLRHKTGVEGRWWVCPELAEMLRREVKTTTDDPELNPGGLAMLTANDLPLVHRGLRSKTDSVSLCWGGLMRVAKRQGVQPFGFSRLRKTGGQMVRNLADLELAKTFLAHRTQSVAERHYVGRDSAIDIGENQFRRLEEVLKRMRAELQPVFDAANAPRRKRTWTLTKPRRKFEKEVAPVGE